MKLSLDILEIMTLTFNFNPFNSNQLILDFKWTFEPDVMKRAFFSFNVRTDGQTVDLKAFSHSCHQHRGIKMKLWSCDNRWSYM